MTPLPVGVTQLFNTVTVVDNGATGPDPIPGNNTGTDTTPIVADPVIAVSKTDGGVSTTPGGVVTYTMTYTNTGNQDATGVVLKETVPTNSTFNAAGSDAGWSCVGVNCTLNVAGTVAGGGGTGTRAFAVTVVNPLPASVVQVANTVVSTYPCSTGTCTSPPAPTRLPSWSEQSAVSSSVIRS